jgi:predicted nucleotidyltransferase
VHADRLLDVLAGHDVAVAYLFGSRAAAVAREDSDHDVAVLFGHDATLGEVGALQAALVGALGTAVDLVELDRAPLELRAKVVQDGRLLLSIDESRRVGFETATRSRWFDYRPVLEELTRAYLHKVATDGLPRG